ncbi:unnamed protein product [Ectocarpus sp. 4 AP-2014]
MGKMSHAGGVVVKTAVVATREDGRDRGAAAKYHFPPGVWARSVRSYRYYCWNSLVRRESFPHRRLHEIYGAHLL